MLAAGCTRWSPSDTAEVVDEHSDRTQTVAPSRAAIRGGDRCPYLNCGVAHRPEGSISRWRTAYFHTGCHT